MRSCRLIATLLTLLALPGGRVPLAAQATASDGVATLLRRIEQIALAGDAAEYLDILSDSADRADARNFAGAEIATGATRVTVKERDRQPLQGTLPGNGYRLSVDVFIEMGARARSATWQLEVKRNGDSWLIASQDRMAQVENLFRLSINPAKQFEARALTISVEDLDLTLDGSAFVIETEQGTTGLVLLGKGEARFHPTPAVEKGQLKIFCGADVYQSRFDATFVRMSPQDVMALVDTSRLTPRPVDARELRRAEEVFREEVAKSYGVDMADMSHDLWSITPPAGDFLAEIHTARHNTLTYARSRVEPEDISFFDRKGRRNIAVYSSKEARERLGRSYNEDDFVTYDVLGYDIDLSVAPDRLWLEGRARLQIRVLASSINSITLRLAETLTVQSIVSEQFGRLLGVRVHNQNAIIVNLPATLLRDDDLVLTVVYAGRLEPQREDVEAVAAQGGRPSSPSLGDESPIFQPERSLLYSNRSYWYPQATVTDYATASLRLTVPVTIDCVASGTLDAGFPKVVPSADAAPPRKVYLFTSAQPLRYLAFVLSRFTRGEPVEVPAGVDSNVTLSVQTNPRQARRGRDLGERATEILSFYGSIVGEAPYPSFTLAVIESELPGGHSPGYFAALNQPLPTSPYVWRNDPASFEDFPEFFIAHEIAHQWWGQAVGWRNYHEQWLSEGFAQYFAALYAQRRRGDETFVSVLRQFRRWGMQQSDQGPIYLGYRLGHIRGDSRVLRAVVYNKAAAVLHMLRRLVGDEQFFLGVRRFYTTLRFKKAGTEDFREAMELETGASLERFFERWIYGSTLPKLKVSYRVEPGPTGQQAIIHVEQLGEVFDLPLTVTIEYADKRSIEVMVPVTDRVVDFPVALTGTVRAVEFGRDEATLAEIVKG